MPRQLFNDEYWNKFKAVLLSLEIYDKPSLRQTVEGIYYRIRVGCPGRDLPATFGNWNAVYKRFNAWLLQEKLIGLFRGLVVEPDLECMFIDGSIVKAHQHSSSARMPQLRNRSRVTPQKSIWTLMPRAAYSPVKSVLLAPMMK